MNTHRLFLVAVGFTLFSVFVKDKASSGADLEHVKLRRDLRKRMVPKILTFAKHQCDAMRTFSGSYSETTFSTKDQN